MKKIIRQPLYAQVAKSLRDFIAQKSFKPGDALPAESALAREFGVSVMTVREALSALAQEGVINRIHGKGNFIREAPDAHVAILCELNLNTLTQPSFFTLLTATLLDILPGLGCEARLYMGHTPHGTLPPYGPTCQEFMKNVEAGLIRGVIAATSYPDTRWQAPLKKRAIPIVGLNSNGANTVSLDLEDMLETGLTALQERGCRRILFFSYGRPDPDQREILHVKEAIERRGLTCVGARCWDHTPLSAGLPNPGETFRSCWADRDHRPDGLLVLDDVLFREIAFTILALHIRIGEELQVVTHSNKGCNNVDTLPLCRLEVDVEACAHAMAQRLLELFRSEKGTKAVVLKAIFHPEPALCR